MNMKKLITITAMATTMLAIGAGTFESIPFNQPTYSDDDPLGVQAIQNTETGLTTLAGAVTTVSNNVNNLDAAIPNKVKAVLTNDTVVVGSAKASGGAGMESTPNSIVFAVNRDIDEMEAANGEILFASDKVRFNVGLNSIWFGEDTLATILSNAGQGEVNAIVGIQTNGQDVAIDGNRKVNITIPAPGEENVITSITTNGVALPINAKVVDIPLQDYVKMSDLQEGISFNTMNVTNLTINGRHVSLEGHRHNATDIDGLAVGEVNTMVSISTNGIPVAPDENRNVALTIPAPGEVNTIVGITTNNVATTIGADRKVNIVIPDVSGFASTSDINARNLAISIAATNAIQGINNAQDIATIKTTLTNFLQNFVIQQ
jgi:hypothetical protein